MINKIGGELRTQFNDHNKGWYLLYILLGIIFIALIGQGAAQDIAPPPIEHEYIFDLQNFTIILQLENVNNNANGLIRETEFMMYNSTFTSKVNEPTQLNYVVSLFHTGESTDLDRQNAVEIGANETKTFTTLISLPKAGINLVKIDFELHEDGSKDPPGEILKGPSLIERKDVKFYHRVLTESDYNSQLERKLLYQFLWITAAPFVILGIKGLRDIFQNK